MKTCKIQLAVSLALVAAAGATQAAGPLYLTEGANPQPLRWDTSNGPIPVYTDGGEAFTFDFDGVTPFITIDRANEITQFAFDQWNNVPTSTFAAEIAGTIEEQTGIADVTGANAAEMYTRENGYGFWVLYDTDGSILEDWFGVPRTQVLGIAFPEWENNGEIIEATAVMNGWNVHVNDTEGNFVAGVFSHEFGHAINLSHSQVNGHMGYISHPFQSQYYPGIAACGVEAIHRWDLPDIPGTTNPADPAMIETMFPFINHTAQAGAEQSIVDHPDDIAGISNIYPTADYASSTGSISGVLRLKDGKTEYSGINVIARNVNNPLFDAVSDMTGSATQGQIGPDGRFTINNLKDGEEYILYIERIAAGGYPTTPMPLVSEGEYWNVGESADPLADNACLVSPILAEAGVTKTADMTFNGYQNGIEFTPVVAAFISDLSKNGRVGAGVAGSTAFIWDLTKGFRVLPPEFKAGNGSLNRNGNEMLVQYDTNGNGIQEPAIWSEQGVIPLGSLSNDTCGGGSSNGVNAASGWAMDDDGKTAVGLAYVDKDGNGSCQQSFANEIVPFIWDKKGGMRELDTSGFASPPQFVRANAISGNGRVVLGTAGFNDAVAWLDEGPMINLGDINGAREAYAVNFDGTKVAVMGEEGVELWNPTLGTGPEAFTDIGSLRWCKDLPFILFGTDYCTILSEEEITDAIGPVPVLPFSMSDNGSVIIGRAGSFRTGLAGAIYIDGMGWITLKDFLNKQGVIEASALPLDNPLAISASGRELIGGFAGSTFSWLIDVDQAFVCEDGNSIQTGFPNGLANKIKAGAEFGRCEHLDD